MHQAIGEASNVVNRFYLMYSGGMATEAFATAVATAGRTNWGTYIEPSLGVFHTLQFTQATDLSSDVGATYTDPTVYTGTDTGDPLAADTAMKFKFLVQRRYRGGHGGFYLGGLVEDRLADPQKWSDATIAELQNDWDFFQDHVIGTSAGGQTVTGFAVVSYYSGFTVITNPVTGRARNVPNMRPVPRVDQVEAVQIDTHVSSQRRRSLIRS